jgi:hypothetical protein
VGGYQQELRAGRVQNVLKNFWHYYLRRKATLFVLIKWKVKNTIHLYSLYSVKNIEHPQYRRFCGWSRVYSSRLA